MTRLAFTTVPGRHVEVDGEVVRSWLVVPDPLTWRRPDVVADTMRDLYAAGVTITEIAEGLTVDGRHLSYRRVRDALLRAGVTLRPRGVPIQRRAS